MATAKKSDKTSTEVEVAESTAQELPKVELKDGIYIERDVELANGRKIEVEVIVDRKKLPATYGSLLAEGNGPALTIATLTSRTRQILDWTGATLEDLEDVLPDVITRSREAADAEDK